MSTVASSAPGDRQRSSTRRRSSLSSNRAAVLTCSSMRAAGRSHPARARPNPAVRRSSSRSTPPIARAPIPLCCCRGHGTTRDRARQKRGQVRGWPLSELPPPGWDPDPQQLKTRRYWNGKPWTDQREPVAEDGGAAPGWMLVVGYLTALLLPLVGLIVGVVLLGHRAIGHGIAMVGISIADRCWGLPGHRQRG
jgi:Protein of unknown function (DUF2510)